MNPILPIKRRTATCLHLRIVTTFFRLFSSHASACHFFFVYVFSYSQSRTFPLTQFALSYRNISLQSLSKNYRNSILKQERIPSIFVTTWEIQLSGQTIFYLKLVKTINGKIFLILTRWSEADEKTPFVQCSFIQLLRNILLKYNNNKKRDQSKFIFASWGSFNTNLIFNAVYSFFFA